MDLTVWAPVLVALVGTVGPVLMFWAQWRKDRKAETLNIGEANQRAALALVEPLRKRVEDLEREADEDRARIDALEHEVEAREGEINELRAALNLKDAEIRALREDLAQERTTRQALEVELDKANTAREERVQRIQDLEGEVDRLRGRLEQLEVRGASE